MEELRVPCATEKVEKKIGKMNSSSTVNGHFLLVIIVGKVVSF